MEINEKLKARKRLKNKGVTLNASQSNELANIVDEQVWKYRKQNQESKIGTRLIYSVIFAIFAIHGWFHASVTFVVIVSVVLVYNFIHFLSDYVFYHNNFRRNPYEEKG